MRVQRLFSWSLLTKLFFQNNPHANQIKNERLQLKPSILAAVLSSDRAEPVTKTKNKHIYFLKQKLKK